MKRFGLAALMVCGVVFCGYAQSEISIDSTNIQHPKGKNRWIIGAELPVFSIASGGKAGLATVTFIYGKQKTERFFLGYGISPSLHFDWRKNDGFCGRKSLRNGYLVIPLYITFQLNTSNRESPFFFDFRRGLSGYVDLIDGNLDTIGLLTGVGFGKKIKTQSGNYFSITANTRVTLAISAIGIVPDLYAGIGVNYHF